MYSPSSECSGGLLFIIIVITIIIIIIIIISIISSSMIISSSRVMYTCRCSVCLWVFSVLVVCTLARSPRTTPWNSPEDCSMLQTMPWLRTNGVNTIGVAAKVILFDRLGKKVNKIDRC